MCTSASVGSVCNDTRTKCDFLYTHVFFFHHLGENLLCSLQSLISMHVFPVGLAVGSFGVQVNLQSYIQNVSGF